MWNKTETLRGVKVFEYTNYGGAYFQTGPYTIRINAYGGKDKDLWPMLRSICSTLIDDLSLTAETDTNAEPRTLDKSLSEWIPLARLQGGDVLVVVDERAAGAVREIGTNGIPWLLGWLHSANPEVARLGIEGFQLLGHIADPALPELVKLANDWKPDAAWSNAIPALASLHDTNGYYYSISTLLPLATNQAAPPAVRRLSVSSIRLAGDCLGTNPAPAISVFIDCLRDDDWSVAAAAADALGHYTLDPKRSIPALAACLISRTNTPAPASSDDDPGGWHGDISARDSAANALDSFASVIRQPGLWEARSFYYSPLEEYREALPGAIPALVKALSDTDCRVARDAASALGTARLKPDLVVPELIKCLEHPEHSVKTAAIEALERFGPAANSAAPALTRLQQDAYVGGWATAALEKINSAKNQ